MPPLWANALVTTYGAWARSEEHTSELQSRLHLVCRLLLEKKKHFVSKKLIYISVQIIGARFRDHVHYLTGVTPVLCVKSIGHDTEMLNAVQRCLRDSHVYD